MSRNGRFQSSTEYYECSENDELEILTGRIQTRMWAKVGGEFFAYEIGRAKAHRQGEKYITTKQLIAIEKYDYFISKLKFLLYY